MKKKYNSTRLGVLALALTLITTCLVGSTMAKYVSEVTGSATAAVAKWSFKANDNTTAFTAIDLGDSSHRDAYTPQTVTEKVIAPGTKGSFDIIIDGTGSEVGIDYDVKITLDADVTLPNDMTFSLSEISGSSPGKSFDTFISDANTSNALKGTLDYDATTNAMKKTITVYWSWDYGTDDTTDANDNTYAGKTWTLDIAITGTQALPTESTPTA